MFKRDLKLFLDDIIESMELIEKRAKGLSYNQFLKDTDSQDIVFRRLEIIGEACKHIPEKIKNAHPEIPWHKISGIRNRITHEYFGIDEKIIWDTVKEALPELKKHISRLRQELKSKTEINK